MDAKIDLPIVGAGAIAEFMFGEDTPENRRKVYYLHEQGVLPTFSWAKQLALVPGDLRSRIDELKAEAREIQLRKREQQRAEAEVEVRRIRVRRGRTRTAAVKKSTAARKDASPPGAA
jgi:hypothetical protein